MNTDWVCLVSSLVYNFFSVGRISMRAGVTRRAAFRSIRKTIATALVDCFIRDNLCPNVSDSLLLHNKPIKSIPTYVPTYQLSISRWVEGIREWIPTYFIIFRFSYHYLSKIPTYIFFFEISL